MEMTSKNDVKLALIVACPFCEAKPGRLCVYRDGPYRGSAKMSGPHAERVAAAGKVK